MCARKRTSGVPYELLGNRIVFTNYFFVSQGSSRWRNAAGDDVTVVGDEGPYDAKLQPAACNPWGIRLKTYPAETAENVLQLDEPWEREGAMGALLRDDGLYRAWIATGWGDLQIFKPGQRPNHYITYRESDDGYHWRAPKCGQFEHDSSKENNIVFETSCFIGGGCSVFRDPVGAPEERYKLVAECYSWTPEQVARYQERWPEDIDARAFREDVNLIMGVRGAVSPDGITWREHDTPLVITHCDTQLICTFNANLGEYVLYTRDYADLPRSERGRPYSAIDMVSSARRSVGIMRSKRFDHFPLPDVALQASPAMRPSEVLYTNCYTTIPGAPEHHLMFPAVWDLCHHDETWIALATSHDGLLWQYASQEPVLETGTFGQWNGGCIYTHPNLTELPNGDWVMPYTGFNVPHKYPRSKAERQTGYARWPQGRLISLKAEQSGQFETIPVLPPGKRLYINAKTRRAGYIRVAAYRGTGEVIPGREMENAALLFGDLHWTPVCWKEQNDLGLAPEEDVVLRFELKEAEIFGLEFR